MICPNKECEVKWCGHMTKHKEVPGCKSVNRPCPQCVPATPEYVRVTKCSDRWMWHYGRIGEIFPVVEEAMHGYVVEIPRHSWISKLDCEPHDPHNYNLRVALREMAEEDDKAPRKDCGDCLFCKRNEDAYPCDVCDPSNNKWEPKKETPMKYKQLKPISL